MTDTRLHDADMHTPSAKTKISVLVQGLKFFSTRLFRVQSVPRQNLSRTETIEQIVRAQGCTCHGDCPHCRHIIDDVLGK